MAYRLSKRGTSTVSVMGGKVPTKSKIEYRLNA